MEIVSNMVNTSLCADDCFSEIVERYKNTVFKIAYTYSKSYADAEDIFQEVFLRYLKSNITFTDEEHRKAWLIRVTINCSKKLLVSAWFKRTVALEEEVFVSPTSTDTSSIDLLEAVLSLPQKYRIVVHLYYYEDYPIKEIAKILDIKESNIQTRLQRGREILKSKLREV